MALPSPPGKLGAGLGLLPLSPDGAAAELLSSLGYVSVGSGELTLGLSIYAAADGDDAVSGELDASGVLDGAGEAELPPELASTPIDMRVTPYLRTEIKIGKESMRKNKTRRQIVEF